MKKMSISGYYNQELNGDKRTSGRIGASLVITDDPKDVTIPGAGTKKMRLYLHSGQIYETEDDIKTTGYNEDLVITLRTVDYCDTNGDKKKMIVLASEPFDETE